MSTPVTTGGTTPMAASGEPAWAGFASDGWWPWGHGAGLWDWLPTWHALGQIASSPALPVADSWALLLACVPALALLIDRMLGEPGVRWHPVVWMGNYLGAAGQRIAPLAPVAGVDAASEQIPQQKTAARAPWARFSLGALAWLVGAALAVAAAAIVQALALGLPIAGTVLILALALKPMLAWAMLHDEVLAVELALGQSIEAGRERLSYLVSRDTSALDEATVRESAIETLAENLCDSVIAPLFWFALLGLPGAVLYRFANTADAMWGYPGAHAGRDWAWAGKWAARADDVLSWAPARITALLLMLGAPLAQWRALPREAVKTPSPNGGWTMGAMALRLGARLGKPGSYVLNEQAPAPQPAHSLQAARRAGMACWAGTALASLAVLGQLLAGGF